MKRLTLLDFISKARAIHGDKYDYSKSVYVNSRTLLCIICPIHGEFWMKPNLHIMGNRCGCPMCSKSHKIDTKEFINRAMSKHGDKYDYSDVKYVCAEKKVRIICKKHGVFEQTPAAHLVGQGCPICANKRKGCSRKMSKAEFIEKAKKKHGNKFEYSKVDYENNRTKVLLTCNTCKKDFLTTPDSHLVGHKCPWCSKKKKTTEMFVEELKSIYKDSFIYNDVVYKKSTIPVSLTCKKHGAFKQTPSKLLSGYGCPFCFTVSKGEKRIISYLDDKDIEYVRQKRFTSEGLLCSNKYIQVDFYLEQLNLIIEYNGIQHYNPVDRFGGEEQLARQQERDFALRCFCDKYNINLIEIKYTDYDKIEEILNKKLK